MTAGARLVALWLKQRGLVTKTKKWTSVHAPTEADYAELARRIDSFARRIRRGSA